jgi:hypothetical protein
VYRWEWTKELLDGQLGSRRPSRRPQLDVGVGVGVGVGVAALGSPLGSEDDEGNCSSRTTRA